MGITLSRLTIAWLAMGLVSGCQDYRPLYGVDAGEVDGGPGVGDEGPWPDDGEAGWPDEHGDPGGDPIPEDGDGPADGGGDPGPTCPFIGGDVWVALDCGGLQGVQRGEVIQEGCDIRIDAGLPFCSGQIDPDGFLELTCSGGVPCTGRLHAEGMPFGVDCAAECGGTVYPVQGECYDNSQCETPLFCQHDIDPVEGFSTFCFWGSMDPDNTGRVCLRSADCANLSCYEHAYCTRPCMPDGTCPPVQTLRPCATDTDCQDQGTCNAGLCAIPSSCQTITEPIAEDPDGHISYGWINLCMPPGTFCASDQDCPPDGVCKLVTDLISLEGYKTVCRPPGDALAGLGWACNDECPWDLCLHTGGEPYCSSLCQEDAECVGPQFYGLCEDVEVELLPGLVAAVGACVQQ